MMENYFLGIYILIEQTATVWHIYGVKQTSSILKARMEQPGHIQGESEMKGVNREIWTKV